MNIDLVSDCPISDLNFDDYSGDSIRLFTGGGCG